MRNLIVEHHGLTFVSHGAQITVWSGAPVESTLLSAATLRNEPADDDELREVADEWIGQHPEHKASTPEGLETNRQLGEVISDVLGDADLTHEKSALLTGMGAVEKLLERMRGAADQDAKEMPTCCVSHALENADALLNRSLIGAFEIGFMVGQRFERRGYRL